MTYEIKLAAKTRKRGEAKKLRTAGLIPGCLYGPGAENINLGIKKVEFEKAFAVAGESHLIDLAIDNGEPVKVLVKDFQKNAVRNEITHVDFYKVSKNKKVTTEIPLHFIGESKAVKELGGILMKEINAVEVKCLPDNLVDFIEIDLSVLNNIDDAVRMHELKLPKGMELVSHTDEIVVHVIEKKAEEEAPAAAPAEEKVEEKKEEEKKA